MMAQKSNYWRWLAGMSLLLAGGVVRTQDAEASRSPDYAVFRVVVERNIFNASRSGRPVSRERETRRPTRVETFGLVGTMEYDQGPLAFFDGSSSDYRKALRPGGSVAGYRLEDVRADAVTLRQASNTFELRLGAQMRREDDGEWKASGQFDAAAAGSSSGGSSSSGRSSSSGGDSGGDSSSGGGGDVSDILKRLMEKREKESQ